MIKTLSKDRIFNIAIIAAVIGSLKIVDHITKLLDNNKYFLKEKASLYKD